MQTIRNPGEWAAEKLAGASGHLSATARAMRGTDERPIAVRDLTRDDLRAALREGADDFAACRTDVLFLVIAYPLAGLAAVGLAANAALLPLLFPAVAGLSLVGPAAAVGLYEMSRRRERGETPSWANAFGLIGSPSFGAMLVLALIIGAIFVVWMGAAQAIYAATLGPAAPTSLWSFLGDVLLTPAGWAMIAIGMGVGFVFACVVLAISVVSFPLLLDREVGLRRAVATSVEVVARNPRVMAEWGLIVAVSLALGSLPFFLGLMFVMPILGHATWRLYRRAVEV